MGNYKNKKTPSYKDFLKLNILVNKLFQIIKNFEIFLVNKNFLEKLKLNF